MTGVSEKWKPVVWLCDQYSDDPQQETENTNYTTLRNVKCVRKKSFISCFYGSTLAEQNK